MEKDYITLFLVGFFQLMVYTLRTRAVTRNNYFRAAIISFLSGLFFWLSLRYAVPLIEEQMAGVVYIFGGVLGNLSGMWVSEHLIESTTWRYWRN